MINDCDQSLTFPQNSVFKDLGEGILQNALQVGILFPIIKKGMKE